MKLMKAGNTLHKRWVNYAGTPKGLVRTNL